MLQYCHVSTDRCALSRVVMSLTEGSCKEGLNRWTYFKQHHRMKQIDFELSFTACGLSFTMMLSDEHFSCVSLWQTDMFYLFYQAGMYFCICYKYECYAKRMWTPESVPVVFRSFWCWRTRPAWSSCNKAGSTDFCRLVLHLYQDSFALELLE